MRTIKQIILHCTASKNGRDYPLSQFDQDHAKRDFRRKIKYREKLNYNLKSFGYHGLITSGGRFLTGRHFDEWGAHVRGSNSDSLGFAMVGTDKFSYGQWMCLRDTIVTTVRYLAEQKRYPHTVESNLDVARYMEWSGLTITGHRDHSPDLDGDGLVEPWEWMKTCPGFDVSEWLDRHMWAKEEWEL